MEINGCVFQGDVGLRRIAERDRAELKVQPRDKHGRIVLAYGKSSGHAHVLRAQGVCLLLNETTGERVLRVVDPCQLLHDMGAESLVETGEHAAIDLPPGDYEVIPQWSWQGQGVQRALD
jgi:hypothetical protein